MPQEQIADIGKLVRPNFDGVVIVNDQFSEASGI